MRSAEAVAGVVAIAERIALAPITVGAYGPTAEARTGSPVCSQGPSGRHRVFGERGGYHARLAGDGYRGSEHPPRLPTSSRPETCETQSRNTELHVNSHRAISWRCSSFAGREPFRGSEPGRD